MSAPRDTQPSCPLTTYEPHNRCPPMISYASLNPGYSDSHSSFSDAPTSMLQQLGGDSGYHDCQHSGTCSCSSSLPYATGSFEASNHQQNQAICDVSFGKGPSLIQGSVSSVLAKYEKSLHAYYEDNGRQMPDAYQLLLLSGLIQAPAPAVRARFQQYLEMDSYSSNSFSYSNHNSQTFVAVPEETELPMLTCPSTALLDPAGLIVGQDSSTHVAGALQFRDDGQTALAIVEEIPRIEVESPVGTEISSIPEITRPERVTWTPSFASLISKIIDARKEKGCGPRVSRHGTGKYHCTSGCGGRFNTSHDWIRHENLRYLQSLWFCIQCGNLDEASEKHLFYREDKFRDHVRRHHPNWSRPGRLGQCKVPNNPSASFPHRCGFCDQKGFRDWAHRCNHIAAHFKARVTMALWRNWPEDEPEEDDDLIQAEPDVPKSGDDNDGNDDDDDDDDDDGDDGNDAQYEAQFHNLPPPGPDTGHNQDECFRDAFEEAEYTFDNLFDPVFYGYLFRIRLSPLQDHQNLEKALQYALPVLSKRRVNMKGGTGSVYKIEVLDTHLPRRLKASDSYDTGRSHIFAMKTYQSKYRRTFDRELAAYTRLNYLDQNHHNILRCFGSFTQQPNGGPTYNLLLEFAECDLDEYFERTPSPDNHESIRKLWEQLFGVVDGLRTIHDGLGTGDHGQSYFGYHADLKPANILRVGSQWKIADFGFSKFVETEDDQPPEQVMDGGTWMYNAPECGRSILKNIIIPVSQKIDVWSMGCILSKAATWIILGFSGIRDFEKYLSAAENQRTLTRFHDGKNVLPSVQMWHKMLRQMIHTEDRLTGKVLDLVDNHLLQGDPRSRFDSKELCAYLEQLLQERDESPSSIAQCQSPTQSFYLNPNDMFSVVYPTISFNRDSFYPDPDGVLDDICHLCGISQDYCVHSSGNYRRSSPRTDTGLYDFYAWAGNDATDVNSLVNHVLAPYRMVTAEPKRFMTAFLYSSSRPMISRRPSRSQEAGRLAWSYTKRIYPPSIRGCEYPKHPSAQHNAGSLMKLSNSVDNFQSHDTNAPDPDVVYVHGLGGQQGWALTRLPSAWRIAEKFEKTDSTIGKAFDRADLFWSHRCTLMAPKEIGSLYCIDNDEGRNRKIYLIEVSSRCRAQLFRNRCYLTRAPTLTRMVEVLATHSGRLDLIATMSKW